MNSNDRLLADSYRLTEWRVRRRKPRTILIGMRYTRGFTLIELMTVVAVLGVAIGVGVPALNQFILDNRLTSQLNMLSSSLALARNEAIKQNVPVVVCVTNSVSALSTTCNTSGIDWNSGWQVFVDRDGDGVYDAPGAGVDGCADGATADCIVSAQAGLTGVNTLRGAPDVVQRLAYNGSGAALCNGSACSSTNSYFVLCDQRGATKAKALAVSRTGRASVITKKPNGSALVCTP